MPLVQPICSVPPKQPIENEPVKGDVPVRRWLSGKKTIIGFVAVCAYSCLIQFAHVQSEPAVWGLILTWTGVSGVIHVDKGK